MSLRYSILGLLAREPSTGYELARKFDTSLRTAWHAQHSQIYPELAKLLGEGLVEVVHRGPRGSKTYGLTDDGRAELRRWLVEVEPDRSQRHEGAVRLFLGHLLPAEDRRVVFQRDLAYAEHRSLELEAIRESLVPGEPFEAQVDLGLRTNEVLIAWLREQIASAES